MDENPVYECGCGLMAYSEDQAFAIEEGRLVIKLQVLLLCPEHRKAPNKETLNGFVAEVLAKVRPLSKLS